MSSNYEERERGFDRDDDGDGGGRSRSGGQGGGRGGGRRMHRRKICRFCIEKVDLIDFKDVKLLQSYIPERGKILPRRISGACRRHQRQVAVAVKRAREMALLPYVEPR